MNDFHTLTVSDITRLTPKSVAISLAIPPNLKEQYSFQAGQYLTFKHTYDGKEIRRAYSICSSPKSGILRVSVKMIADGSFSEYANNILKVGDTLEALRPAGKFVLKPEENKNYAAFAAGSGITPILSQVYAVLEGTQTSTFLLAYGNQTMAETMFASELLELKQKHPNRFFLEFIFSRNQEENAMFGRIERSTINFLLKNKFKETTFEGFYLCGPEAMIDEVSSTLKQNGINHKQIHHELFTTAETDLLVKPHDGNTTITVTVDGDTTTFVMPQTTSVLQAVLDEGLDPPYSCQGGICSTCIARIKEGKAEMRKNQILTDGEVAEGLVLTCQAHPTTATFVVDYDDV